MGYLSVSIHRGLVHWQGLLLIVSLLIFWCLPTNAQFAIVSTTIAEGKEVRLYLHNKPQNAIGYRWYKGEWVNPFNLIASYFPWERSFEKGQFYENRMIINMDGTLLIKKAALRDRGMYTIVAYLPNEVKEVGFGRLNVYQPVTWPLLLLTRNSTVSENDTVVLDCLSHALSIEWLFNGKALQLSKRMELSHFNKLLIIDPVQMEDAGYYQCKAHDPIRSVTSWPLVLYVHHE